RPQHRRRRAQGRHGQAEFRIHQRARPPGLRRHRHRLAQRHRPGDRRRSGRSRRTGQPGRPDRCQPPGRTAGVALRQQPRHLARLQRFAAARGVYRSPGPLDPPGPLRRRGSRRDAARNQRPVPGGAPGRHLPGRPEAWRGTWPMSLLETALAPGTPDARRLRLHVPAGQPPRGGWPLLVLLDGDWVWPPDPPLPAAAACAVLIPGHGGRHGPLPSLLAARGMPAQTGMQTQALARRALDFTPPAPGGGQWPDPRRPEWQCGGADAYLDALLGPMLDWAAAQTRLDPARLSLYGHSYGGLCALYTLTRHPGRFAHTICASPSLWWREGHIEALLDGLPDRLPADARVRLTLMAGTDERW